MSVNAYIEKLPLADVTLGKSAFQQLQDLLGPARSAVASLAPPGPPMPANLKAAVDAGSLLSFVSGVSAPERDDVLFSVQLAQRGASGTFDRFTQTQSWYQKYLEILENVGWTAEQFAFAKYDQGDGELKMDKAALAIIAAIATQNQLAVLQQSIQALKDLAENDHAISIFDFHSSVEQSGNFQIGAVQKADNGALALALGGFYFRSVDSRRRFLFFAWGKQTVNFWKAAQKMTLNQTLYALCRDQVQKKLGAGVTDFIGALNIP